MSLIPGLPKGLDITESIATFQRTLRSIDAKLDTLIELQREANRAPSIEER